MSATQSIVCPKCGRADAVRKVSAIVAEGTQSGETNGIGLGFGDHALDLMTFVGASTSRSALAAMLAPPAKPAKPCGYWWIAALTFGRIGLVFFIELLLIGLTLLSFVLLINVYSRYRTLLMIPFVGLMLFVVASGLWVLRSARRDYQTIVAERKSYANKLRAWEHAAHQWEKQYYCARDDCLFTSNKHVFISINK